MLDLLTAGYMELHPEGAARALARLDEREIAAFLGESPPRLAADVLAHMPPPLAARSLQRMLPDTAVRIVPRIPTEAAAEALRAMDRARMRELLAALPRTASARLRIRLRYPEGSIGSVVDADVFTLAQDMLVGEAVRATRRTPDRLGHALYVLDGRRRLKGVVDVCELLAGKDRLAVARMMSPPPVVLHARTSVHSVENHPAWLRSDALPVVTRAGVFQGVLPRTAVVREESALIAEVAQQQQATATQSALSDVFWLAVAALFVSQPSQKESPLD